MKRIFLIRHGESEGNADKTVYSKKPDYAVLLTEKGKQQAKEVGDKFESLGLNSVHIFYSPFFRTRQTMDIATKKMRPFCKIEDARIREQEWTGELRGFDLQREKDRIDYGIYYYRYPGGESCADVELRVASFFESIKNFDDDILIFTHGMTMRVMAKYLLQASVEGFQTWGNPKNGEVWGFEDSYVGKYGGLVKGGNMIYGKINSKYKNPYEYPRT